MTEPNAGPLREKLLYTVRDVFDTFIPIRNGCECSVAFDRNAALDHCETLVAEARVNAAAEMRQRCAQESEEPICHEASCPIHNGGDTCDCAVGDLTDSIRALPLAPQDEAWLRAKIEQAIEAGIEYADERKEWTPSSGDWRGPERPTPEAILAEAAKERT